MNTEDKLTGGCLCGAVRYEARGEPLGACHCHCEKCRRSSGSAFVTAVGFPTEAVTWIKEEPVAYRSSENASRLFCPHCGSSMAHQWLDIGTMWPFIGTLDDPESVTPEFHIFTKEQLSWVKLDDGLPCHLTFAPTRKGKQGDESFSPEVD